MNAIVTATRPETLEDLLEALGGIPPSRVWVKPAPGQATEADVIEAHDRWGWLCELVDGVLVEKAVGVRESFLAMALGRFLQLFVNPRNLGIVLGADAALRLMPGLVRLPDVSFISWGRMPGGRIPEAPIPDLAPDLAVEVLSESNTKREMQRKLREYLDSGVRLAWLIDPRVRTVAVHTPDGAVRLLDAAQALDGGDVLPGFVLPLADLFAELDRHG